MKLSQSIDDTYWIGEEPKIKSTDFFKFTTQKKIDKAISKAEKKLEKVLNMQTGKGLEAVKKISKKKNKKLKDYLLCEKFISLGKGKLE